MSRYKLYLKDILKAIEQIEKSLEKRGRVYFEKDSDAGDATAMRLQVIGESIHKLPKELKKKYKEIDWEGFVDFRNGVSHAYFRVNKDMLWDAVHENIPELKKVIRRVIDEK